MQKQPEFTIVSSLGATDCSGCRISKDGRKIFAKHALAPGESHNRKHVSLPLKIAEMPNEAAAAMALKRIRRAIKEGEPLVDVMDLEYS